MAVDQISIVTTNHWELVEFPPWKLTVNIHFDDIIVNGLIWNNLWILLKKIKPCKLLIISNTWIFFYYVKKSINVTYFFFTPLPLLLISTAFSTQNQKPNIFCLLHQEGNKKWLRIQSTSIISNTQRNKTFFELGNVPINSIIVLFYYIGTKKQLLYFYLPLLENTPLLFKLLPPVTPKKLRSSALVNFETWCLWLC